MSTAARRLDTAELEDRVERMYHEVAEKPQHDFHFESGGSLAERLGDPAAELDRIPAAAIESFAGVGFFLDLAAITAGETVLDLGSDSGTDSFLAAVAAGSDGHAPRAGQVQRRALGSLHRRRDATRRLPRGHGGRGLRHRGIAGVHRVPLRV